ncbi:hypothetical protein [Photobacterium sp. TY1-4]|uniref:hypothetical protein n=1 Tax=Photobacterium sp. TY1-4 TaxID=2899122 RepID=UPI0021C020B8|nr:hypothetical protein [Photobacterium sp. TY1-4]UXI02188.1 hypothetical protein NH461_05255 [Photobacterium sp. TY1-4]
MNLVAYDVSGQHKQQIVDATPSGATLSWLESPECLTSLAAWRQAQVLVIAAASWPDRSVEYLIETFSPRHVVLVDLTPECHWYGTKHHNNLHLCEGERLAELLNSLIAMEVVSASTHLALLSARNDFDSALLAISLAWQMAVSDQQAVLILDLGQPSSDIANYLNKPAGIDFISLQEKKACISKPWLLAQGVALHPMIHVIGMPDNEQFDAVTKEVLLAVMEKLEAAYDSIIINLAGIPPCPLVFFLAKYCQQHWLLSDQKNVSLANTRRLAESLFQVGVRPGGVNVVLAPFLPQVLPGKTMIASQLALPIRGELPCAHTLTTDINAGTLLPPTGQFKEFLQQVEKLLSLKPEKPHWLMKFGWRYSAGSET